MSTLVSFLSDLIVAVLSKIGIDISNLVKQQKAVTQQQDSNANSAQASVTPLNNAKTGDDVAKSANDAFNGT